MKTNVSVSYRNISTLIVI